MIRPVWIASCDTCGNYADTGLCSSSTAASDRAKQAGWSVFVDLNVERCFCPTCARERAKEVNAFRLAFEPLNIVENPSASVDRSLDVGEVDPFNFDR